MSEKNIFHALFSGNSLGGAKTRLSWHISLKTNETAKQEAYNYYGTQLGTELFQALGDFIRAYDGDEKELNAKLGSVMDSGAITKLIKDA